MQRVGGWRWPAGGLGPGAAGGPMGIVRLTQRGRLLSGFVVMWGLEPGSSHAAHLHGLADGSSARCLPESARTTRHVANLPDLTADASGVAFGIIRMGVNEAAVRRGVYAMVHTHPSPPAHMAGMVHDNPPIACGNFS